MMRASAWRLLEEVAAEARLRVLPANTDDLTRLSAYRGREADFMREVLGCRLWEAQVAATEALFGHRFLAWRSSRKSGKSYWAGNVVVAALHCSTSIVLTTAPTERQVKEVLWSEARRAHRDSAIPLPSVCDTMQMRMGADRYAIGLTTNRPERFQGFHAGVDAPEETWDAARTREQIERAAWRSKRAPARLLIIGDEAPGIPQEIIEALKGSMSGERVHVAWLGNPLMDPSSDHEFARIHQPGSRYHRLKTSCEPRDDDPLTCDAEHITPPWLVSPDWIEQMRQEWGEDSPLFRAHVLGQFAAPAGDDSLCPLALLETAAAAGYTTPQGAHMGVDLARMGGDQCVASLWVDGVKRAEHTWGKTDLMASAELIVALSARWAIDGKPVPAEHIHVDDTGLGGGCVDRLRQKGWQVDAVDFGKPARGDWKHLCGPLHFRHRRAELHWSFRRVLQEGLGHLPKKWTASWQEAQWPRYEMRPSSQGTELKVESKDDIRARHGRSPDHLDADLLAWARGGSGIRFGRVNLRRRR